MAKGELRVPRTRACVECNNLFETVVSTRTTCSDKCGRERKVRMNKERGKGRCGDCGGIKANLYATRCRACAVAARSRSECSVEGCGRPHCAQGFCSFHRTRAQRGIPLDAYVKGTSGYRRGETNCSVQGCAKPTFSGRTGHCTMHHERYRSKGSVGSAASTRRPPGAWVPWQVDKFGYVRRRENGKWVTQHRVVMEEKLGRPLLSSESVHHINGDRADNRPTNLELWSKSQPSGQRVTDKVAWAVELLELYAPELLADRAVQLKLVT